MTQQNSILSSDLKMTKRQKQAEAEADEYLAIAGFGIISLDSIPFESLALGLSTLSAKDLLHLHGLSTEIRVRKWRAITAAAILIKLRKLIGDNSMVEIDAILNHERNDRLLFIAAIALQNNEYFHRHGKLFPFKHTNPDSGTVKSFSLSISIRANRTKLVWVWARVGASTATLRGGERVLKYKYNGINDHLSIPIVEWISQKKILEVSNPYVFQLLMIYAVLIVDSNNSFDNRNVFPDFPSRADIRCSICDSSAKLVECKDCNEQFCSNCIY